MMNREDVIKAFDDMTPNENQKLRMFYGIPARPAPRRHTWRILTLVAAGGLALAILFSGILTPKQEPSVVFALRGEDEGVVYRLGGNEGIYENMGANVEKVGPDLSLEFFIEYEGMATLDITSENEYLYAVDWTRTQDKAYWRYLDEEGVNPEYVKSLYMTFEEGFEAFGDIWYRWVPATLDAWVREDLDSRMFGFGDYASRVEKGALTPEEALYYASSDADTNRNHYNLAGYPEELLKDQLTITITDHKGNTFTHVINIAISTNEIGQTVLTASVDKVG